MTKAHHFCSECRKLLLVNKILHEGMKAGDLQRAIDDTQEKVEEFDRVIAGLNDMNLGLFASEALSAFLNARSRYRAALEVLKEKQEGGVSKSSCLNGKCASKTDW